MLRLLQALSKYQKTIDPSLGIVRSASRRMIITAQHRNYKLAMRHLAKLRREYASAELLSRRNKRGQFSCRGQFYVFEVTKETQDKIELVAHFDYGSSKARDLLRFQVHIVGPGDVSDNEALRVISEHFEEGKSYPKGWKQKTIYWGHVMPESSDDVEHEYVREDARQTYLARLAIGSGERRVSRRRTIKKNRRTRKGSPKK